MLKTRPFLKWAGGKYQLIEKIRQCLPLGYRLIEPFAGAGSVFLNTDYTRYVLADINPDLINCFLHLQQEQQPFIEACRLFFQTQHNCKTAFWDLRARFNTTDDQRLKSILFVYLNRHCFNGLMRYNKKGLFNTSFGDYSKPYFPEKEMIAFANKANMADILCANYIQVMEKAIPGDVIYCDPPYVPLSDTANFTKYHSTGFTSVDQAQLADMAMTLAKRGIPVVISNHDTDVVRNLYHDADLIHFSVQRNISCQGLARNKAPELLALFN